MVDVQPFFRIGVGVGIQNPAAGLIPQRVENPVQLADQLVFLLIDDQHARAASPVFQSGIINQIRIRKGRIGRKHRNRFRNQAQIRFPDFFKFLVQNDQRTRAVRVGPGCPIALRRFRDGGIAGVKRPRLQLFLFLRIARQRAEKLIGQRIFPGDPAQHRGILRLFQSDILVLHRHAEAGFGPVGFFPLRIIHNSVSLLEISLISLYHNARGKRILFRRRTRRHRFLRNLS